MKKVLLFFLFIFSISAKGQCLLTNYASCNDSIGSFSFDPTCYPNCLFVWSTGDTSNTVFLKPGAYTVSFIDTVNITTNMMPLTMYHDTWHMGMNLLTNDSSDLYLWAQLPSCGTSMSTHPSCYPWWYDPYCIVWEDSIPIDTFPGVNCSWWSYPVWHYAKPGHRYDLSIVDTLCHCFEATWMTNPPGTYYYYGTGIDEHKKNISVFLSPNPFHNTAVLAISDLPFPNYELKIFDVMGRLMRQQIINSQSSIINREGLPDGIYFYQLETHNAELLGSGKFVVN